MPAPPVYRVISGGQTGVDRAALDVAISIGLEHGGWCPKGRIAEDGCIPAHYQLRETDSFEYAQRTEKNVIDSDGTLILYQQELSGGTQLTFRLCKKHRRPVLTIDLSRAPLAHPVREWLRDNNIGVLNIAGPRESSSPGVGMQAESLLVDVLDPSA